MNVDKLIDEVIEREGGYSNHPADRGGPTNFGITEQTARAYGYKGDMKVMPRATAVSIYRARYWTAPRFNEVAIVCPQIAEEIFDTGVNMGVGRAGTFLQRALNALNRQAADYPDIGTDGLIGNLTLTALKGFMLKRGAGGGEVLRKALDALQGEFYLNLAEKNPSQEAFVYGWLANRVG